METITYTIPNKATLMNVLKMLMKIMAYCPSVGKLEPRIIRFVQAKIIAKIPVHHMSLEC